MMHFNPTRFIIESIFSGAIVLLCFLIFFKTKEMYELTKHKGIGFFRATFLIFGIAHIFRFFYSISHLIFDPRTLLGKHNPIMPILIAPIGFFGTLALIYLLYSIIWKKYEKHTLIMIIIANAIALIIPILTFVYRSKELMVFFQALIFILIIGISFKSYFKNKKISKMFLVYVLMFIFWLINLIGINPNTPYANREWLVIPQILSVCIFIIIYYKVSKWTK